MIQTNGQKVLITLSTVLTFAITEAQGNLSRKEIQDLSYQAGQFSIPHGAFALPG